MPTFAVHYSIKNKVKMIPDNDPTKRITVEIADLKVSSYSGGAYALVLKEVSTISPRYFSIVIGSYEAQAILIAMKGIKTPRPLTHDLFVSFLIETDYKIVYVFIYKVVDGIFYSKIYFHNDESGKSVLLDSRTSDAISMALRCKVPIYATESVISYSVDLERNVEENFTNQYFEHQMAINELQEELKIAIKSEDYERASTLRDQIKNLKENI
jgi:uncharacterized protein